MYHIPSRASRTGAFLSKGAVRKWLSWSRKANYFNALHLFTSTVHVMRYWRIYHPMSSWKKLFKVVKTWWWQKIQQMNFFSFSALTSVTCGCYFYFWCHTVAKSKLNLWTFLIWCVYFQSVGMLTLVSFWKYCLQARPWRSAYIAVNLLWN